MKIAIVHDWLVTYAGAEKVLEDMITLYPEAELYSIVDFLDKDQRHFIKNKTVHTSFIQNLPFAKKKYRQYLPLMPLAIEQFDLSKYDVVLSSSHAVAKGVITGPDQLHISYVHTPIRYAWDLQFQYLKETGMDHGIKGGLAKWLLHKMRIWDYRTAHGVNHFIANSNYISRRIKKVYGRESIVIFPPVDTDSFSFSSQKEEFYLTASRMVPYKKIDLIVEAFSKMPEKKLVVIGDGPDYQKIVSKATKNVTILGYQPTNILREHLQKAKAFVFAAEEDFGIIPVEAQACGTPVIAFGKGGILDTVRDLSDPKPTGIFFEEQEVDSIIQAIFLFEKERDHFTPENCRENSALFSRDRFRKNLSSFIESKYNEVLTNKQLRK